jgi:hypothetical protein
MLKNNLPAGVFYVPAYELYDRSDWTFDPVKIAELKHQPCIIDYSTENYNNSVPHAYEYFASLGINFIILSHDPAHHLLKPNLLFYPYWHDWSRNRLTFPNLDQSASKSHLIASMSRNPRTHRIVNYVMLRDKPYFDPVVITAHRETTNKDHITRPDDMIIPEQIQQHWDRIEDSLPATTITQLQQADNVTHPGYTDSYMHLIVETSVSQGFFVTEKIWQPIASGQLFLVWGSVNSIGHLRDMGVDVFDDFIDHKYYDTEQDPLTRLHRIHAVLDSLAAQDLYNIYAHTRSRRESNVAKFKNGTFGAHYREQLTRCINMLN